MMTPEYVPNQIPRAVRVLNVIYATVVLLLGLIGLFTGSLLLPGKRTSGANGMSLHGPSAWLMYAAMACAICVLLAPVIDHYDRRNNEASYQRLTRIAKVLGWTLFPTSLALHALGF